MRKIIVLVLCCCLALALQSATIKGKVVDSRSKEPLDYVNVSLVDNSTKKMVTGVVSDGSGTFSLTKVSVGDFTVQASFMGYKTVERKIVVSTLSQDVDLGIFRLAEDTQLLGEVEVVSQGTQMRLEIDKKVFSVDQNLAAAGASVSEVLQNIPSVDVDGEGNVSLRNNSNVEVWINGKPSGLTEENRAQILEQMPAGSIESVELITNPSAKYSPEGTAGVINLVLKKNNAKTYYGSVSTGIRWPTGGLPGGNVGASFNYNSSKVDVYANLGLNCHNMIRGSEQSRYSLKNSTDTLSLLETESKSKNNMVGLYVRAGVDYHINERNTIGVSAFGMGGQGKNSTDISYSTYDYLSPNHPLLRQYTRDNAGKNQRPVYNTELSYKHDFKKKGSFLKADVSAGNFNSKKETTYVQEELLGDSSVLTGNETQKSSNGNLRVEAKADFTYKFTEKRRLEAGWESDYSHRRNIAEAVNNLTNEPILGYYNNFDYREQIHSLYATYGDMFGKFSMQLGLRGEYMKVNTTSESNAETISSSRDYLQLFPSVFLAYSFPKNHELQLNYTRRVNRPRGRQINPYKDFSDSTSIFYGNPYLAPQFSSSFELNYLKMWNNHSLSASAYYKFTDDVIQRVGFRNQNVMENTYMNVTKQQSAGLELVAKNKLFKILNLTTSVNLYYEKLDSALFESPYGDVLKIDAQENFSWNARLMANIMITKTTSAQITGNYRAPRIIAQGKQNHDYSIDLGFRQTFLEGALSLNLTARDILDSRRFRSETWGTGFYQLSKSYWSGRTIGLVVSYNFGNFKSKKKKMESGETSAGSDMEEMEF